MFRYHKKKKTKTKRNTITVRACLSGDDIGLEIEVRPKKAAKKICIPYRTKLEKRGSIVYDAGLYERFNAVIQSLHVQDFNLKNIPLNIHNLVRLRNARVDVFRQDNVNRKIWDQMYPFQQEGVRRAISKNYGKILFCDEMGLGKSLQSLAVAHYYKYQWPLLIICPSYLRYNWMNEIIKWDLGNEDDIQVIMNGKQDIDHRKKVIIISYDLTVKLEEQLQGFRVVICDESHYIKSRKAKRTKTCLPILKKAKRVLLLSGTPALSRPSELFTQLAAVAPSTFVRFRTFAERYCDAKMGPFGWDVSGMSNPEELQVINRFCMIRRLKKDVLKQLPPKRREELVVPLNDKEIKELEPAFNELRELNVKIHTAKPASKECRDMVFVRKQLMSGLFRQTAHIKAPLVSEYLKNTLPTIDHKLIVFAHHRGMLDAIQEACEYAKKTFIRIDGSTPQKKRSQLVTQFRGKKDVAILSIGACGTGFNFTMCAHVLFAELTWNPGELLQAEDRTHRIGQEADSVFIQYLIADGSLDNYVWKKLQKKFNTVNTILNDQNEEGFDAADNELDFELERPKDKKTAPVIKNQQTEAFYKKRMGALGINNHAVILGECWYPMERKLGVFTGVNRALATLKVEHLMEQHGTKVTREFLQSHIFLDNNVETTSGVDVSGRYINMHEFSGDLRYFWDNDDNEYFILTDTKTPLSIQ